MATTSAASHNESHARTLRVIPRSIRAAVAAIAATLSIAAVSTGAAQAAGYDFVSVYRSAVGRSQFTATLPSVTNAGTVAFAELFFDPGRGQSTWMVVKGDGTQLLPVLNLTDAFGTGSPLSLVINDAGAIAVTYSMGARQVIARINADGSLSVLAEADQAGTTPYRDFAAMLSMNDAGQVAALVTNQDTTSSVLRIDPSGVVEVARASPSLFNFSSPTLNSSGVVAFRAEAPAPGTVSVYTGSGGPLTDEGAADPCGGASGFPPVINDDGFVLSDCGGPPLFTARGGIVDVVLTGNEDPIFAQLAAGYSLNSRRLPAFVTAPAGVSTEAGLFTGYDPAGHKVVRTGDVVFGLPVEGIGMGHRAINDRGQIAIVLHVGDGATAASHIVLASPARAPQTIVLSTLPVRTFGDPPFVATATASSGLPVTFSTARPCSVAGSTVSVLGAGSCTITASQPGDVTYLPAADVSQAFAIDRAAQTIVFGPLPDRTFGDPPFLVTAAAGSGLPVMFSGTGACSVAADLVTVTGGGICTVTASQAGDANYGPAPDVAQTFAIARAAQTITFAPPPNRTLSDPPLAVSAVASSGLLVSFAAAGSCSVTEAMVSPTGAGYCTITASQSGNADFEPALAVARAFLIDALILGARLNAGADGFGYIDNAFRSTGQAGYASGAWIASGGFKGGALKISLGGINSSSILGMSGGWATTFSLSAHTKVMLHFRANLTLSAGYESDEKSQLLVSVDGALIGRPPNDYLAQLAGGGGSTKTTGWRLFQVNLGTLGAGTHTLVIGGYNNKKNSSSEFTTLLIDDVLLVEPTAGARAAVAGLTIDRFKENIRILSAFGDRTQGTPSNINASNWLESALTAAGYAVQRHPYLYLDLPRYSLYVTKVGTIFPDQMYIVSAHMDGRGGGGATNDNASGSSLVLEAARALAGLETAVSVRFIFWNNEETGLNGSTAYVNERASRQGVENPAGSGIYPEPRWLGMIQHDQILFDHGLPPQPNQIPGADIDVEYQASSTFAAQALQLANALQAGSEAYSTDYPAQVGSNMDFTDSVPFRNYTAAVSVRDNQRVAEIGQGSNPHWHKPTDVYSAFSEADFLLGLNAVQMTLGTVAERAGAMILP